MIAMIVLNGRQVRKNGRRMSYEELVEICRPSTHCPDSVYTVTYSKGVGGAQGELTKGESVAITDRMVFNVVETGNG